MMCTCYIVLSWPGFMDDLFLLANCIARNRQWDSGLTHYVHFHVLNVLASNSPHCTHCPIWTILLLVEHNLRNTFNSHFSKVLPHICLSIKKISTCKMSLCRAEYVFVFECVQIYQFHDNWDI